MRHKVVGGGLAGLTAALELARGGAEVDLYEQRQELGGRAISSNEGGAWLNLGPHALYKNGLTLRTLAGWGLDLPGGEVKLSGNVFLVRNGEKYALPTGFAGLATTGALSIREKLDFATAYARLTALDPEAVSGQSTSEWMDAHVSTDGAREVLSALLRLSTYAAEPGPLALDAVVRQAALSGGGVVYLDGGWQSLIQVLSDAAARAGVRIHTGTSPVAVESSAILAVSPSSVEALTGVHIPHLPVRMATLDLVLDKLPEKAAYFALGVDQPLYFSVHSQWAKLSADGRAVVHAAKYLAPDAACTREELEQWCDLTMPGWRSHVIHSRFLPDLVVVHAAPLVRGRPSSDALGEDGIVLAGDWIGPDGMLADTAVASGLAAARQLMRHPVAV